MEEKMKKKKKTLLIVAAALLLSVATAQAHTPLCTCFDNGDETITCEGGFSDGSSAAGVTMRVFDKDNKLLIESKMNADSEFTFNKPTAPYKVEFDAGPGHKVEIDGDDIAE